MFVLVLHGQALFLHRGFITFIITAPCENDLVWFTCVTIGLLIFEDKKFEDKIFRGFHGQLLNHENKYPLNFLYTLFYRNRNFFVVDVVVKWLFGNTLSERSRLLYHCLLAVYLRQYLDWAISTDGIVAANKEVQHMMDSINDGTLLKRGPYECFDDEERAQIDHPSQENHRHMLCMLIELFVNFRCIPVTLKIFSQNFFFKAKF